MEGFLKEDETFIHVIAIDFGTGASGYDITQRTQLNQKPRIKYLIYVMIKMTKRHCLQSSLITIKTLSIMELEHN